MSHESNTQLLERAAAVCDYFESTVIQEAIEELIKNNELDELNAFVQQQEQEIGRQSQEHFNNWDMLGGQDVF